MHVFELKQKYIKIVDKDFNKKCDACDFDSNKDKGKQKTLRSKGSDFIINCDNIVEHKEIILTKKMI